MNSILIRGLYREIVVVDRKTVHPRGRCYRFFLGKEQKTKMEMKSLWFAIAFIIGILISLPVGEKQLEKSLDRDIIWRRNFER